MTTLVAGDTVLNCTIRVQQTVTVQYKNEQAIMDSGTIPVFLKAKSLRLVIYVIGCVMRVGAQPGGRWKLG